MYAAIFICAFNLSLHFNKLGGFDEMSRSISTLLASWTIWCHPMLFPYERRPQCQ